METGETAATRRGVPGPSGPPEAGETSGRTESLQMEPALPTPWSRTWPPQPRDHRQLLRGEPHPRCFMAETQEADRDPVRSDVRHRAQVPQLRTSLSPVSLDSRGRDQDSSSAPPRRQKSLGLPAPGHPTSAH